MHLNLLSLEFWIAIRYLSTKRKDGFVSVISAFSCVGIALGVATLIIVTSVMQGFENTLLDKILHLNGHITVSAAMKSNEDAEKLTRSLRSEYVEFIGQFIAGQGVISNKYGTTGVMFKGMDIGQLALKPIIKEGVIKGSLQNNNSKYPAAAIGKILAESLNLNIGSTFKLITPKSTQVIIGAIPTIKTFRVTAIFDVKMYEYNSSLVFIPLHYAKLMSANTTNDMHFEVLLKKKENTKLITKRIKENLSDTPHTISTWDESNSSLMEALKIERNVMFFILSLIILIAAFNIVSSLIILVNNKRASIAILRTIGFGKYAIMRIFMLCGIAIGALGTTFGLIIGVLFMLNIENIKDFLENLTGLEIFNPAIYFLTNLPSEISWSNVVCITTLAAVVSVLATIYPAYRAASLMPAALLRYE